MNLVRYLLIILIMSLTFSNIDAQVVLQPNLSMQKTAWKSEDLNHPHLFVFSNSAAVDGKVGMESSSSTRIDCTAANGQVTRFLVYRGGTFTCPNAKKILITSTSANAHSEGFFIIRNMTP